MNTSNSTSAVVVGHARDLRNKVPEVTLYFWLIKVLSTTLGETAADFLNASLNLGLSKTSLIVLALFVVALGAQMFSKTYMPVRYWLAVVLVSVLGTLITDNLTDQFGVPLEVSTLVFSIGLAATFLVWYYVEETLSIHEITTWRREAFYWTAILMTFALGTAAGDLLAERYGMGYLHSALLFGAAIAIVAIAHFVLEFDPVTTFWSAYVLTRPLGASLGDLLSQPRKDGGLAFGATGTSVLFALIIVAIVIHLSVMQRRERAQPPH